MSGERKLPQVKIEGTWFVINVDKERLEQRQFPWNTIRFADMVLNGDHYFFRYDPAFKNIHHPMDDGSRVKLVSLPMMKELDPEGMAVKYQLPVEEVRRLSDAQLKQGLKYKDISQTPLPMKRKRGRPLGSRNRLKYG